MPAGATFALVLAGLTRAMRGWKWRKARVNDGTASHSVGAERSRGRQWAWPCWHRVLSSRLVALGRESEGETRIEVEFGCCAVLVPAIE